MLLTFFWLILMFLSFILAQSKYRIVSHQPCVLWVIIIMLVKLWTHTLLHLWSNPAVFLQPAWLNEVHIYSTKNRHHWKPNIIPFQLKHVRVKSIFKIGLTRFWLRFISDILREYESYWCKFTEKLFKHWEFNILTPGTIQH